MLQIIFCFLYITSAISTANPIYDKNYFEALERQNDTILSNNSESFAEKGKWSNGQIPVLFSLSFNDTERYQIVSAMNEISKRTCVRFHTKTSLDEDFIVVLKIPADGCSSTLGRQGDEQQLRLGIGCLNQKSILRQLMYALGFDYEHNRHDRDNYVIILVDNIIPEYKHLFEKRREDNTTTLGDYGYDSILHFEKNAFPIAKDIPTIVPKQEGIKLGADTLSDVDVQKINRYYNCDDVDGNQTATTSPPSSTVAPSTATPVTSTDASLPLGFKWKVQEDGITWATDCDFPEHNLQNIPSKGEQCGPLCVQTLDCDHFAWNDHNGGTCWMKTGYNPTNTRKTSGNGIVCGFIQFRLEKRAQRASTTVSATTKASKTTKAPEINWNKQDDGITWALDCDFPENDLKNVPSKGEDCGPLCAKETKCDHFAWNNYNGGTCWMKNGYDSGNVKRASGEEIICGFIHGKRG